jgi:hypothetical protein
MMYGYDGPICTTCNTPTDGKECVDCTFAYCGGCLDEHGRCLDCRIDRARYERSRTEAMLEDHWEAQRERARENRN